MANYRDQLPQLGDTYFITDAGMETELVFNHGIELPEFASYPLLKSEKGFRTLYDYYASFAALAVENGLGAVLETPTWRASDDWGGRLGDSHEGLGSLNRKAVALLEAVRSEHEKPGAPIVISGNVGPRGDGYTPGDTMSVAEARRYHLPQVRWLADSNVDLVTAMTLNYVAEGIGIARAAVECGVPVVLSFTVETDGRLPTGESLADAIREVDAASDSAPVYYMVNCAHPTHFSALLDSDEEWVGRIRGVRCNASRCSHEELDNATELDDGDPVEFGELCAELNRRNAHINILGGCCGTDIRHIEQICRRVSFAAQNVAVA